MTVTALPTRVRFGYSLGSLVTGAFGTVPGLLLLPFVEFLSLLQSVR